MAIHLLASQGFACALASLVEVALFVFLPHSTSYLFLVVIASKGAPTEFIFLNMCLTAFPAHTIALMINLRIRNEVRMRVAEETFEALTLSAIPVPPARPDPEVELPVTQSSRDAEVTSAPAQTDGDSSFFDRYSCVTAEIPSAFGSSP